MRKYACVFVSMFALQTLSAQTILIKNVTIIDVKTGKTVPGQSVVVNNEKIELTGPVKKIKDPVNAELVDGTGKFLMPGMTDAHIHFFQWIPMPGM